MTAIFLEAGNHSAASDAADVRREAYEALLPSALDLLRRMAAVGRKAEPVELVEERAVAIRTQAVALSQ